MTKIGILGLGSIGSRHAANFKALGCEVVGFDPSDARTDFDKVFDVDALVVASPTDLHFSHIMEGNGHRIPMLVEKPLVCKRWQLEQVPLEHVKLVGYNLRFHSCVQIVRDWLGQGIIGKPLWANFTCAQFNNKEVYLRDGVILNWSHEIDLAIHLLGQADVLTAAYSDKEDVADILLKHYNHGCHTTVHLDYLTKPERRGFVIVGADGSIDADLVARQAFLKDNDNKIVHTFFGRAFNSVKDDFDGDYLAEAEAFLSLIKGKPEPGHLIGCTAIQAADVVDICLEVKEFHGE